MRPNAFVAEARDHRAARASLWRPAHACACITPRRRSFADRTIGAVRGSSFVSGTTAVAIAATAGGGTIISAIDNRLANNTTAGSFTSTLAKQ